MSRRIVIADDHLIVREGLRVLLEQAGFELVGEALDGVTALRLCGELQPDVAVLDLGMPLLNGADCAREIRRVSPKTATIVLTMYDDDRYLTETIRAGAMGYVLKSAPADELLEAIDAVLSGDVYVLGETLTREALRDTLERKSPNDLLTTRERQVLNLVVAGRATKEIASDLGISIKTAESHRVRIMKKLNTHNTAGLVRYAIRVGLVLP
jgi:two-component system, NarL family, response regulator NreC